MRGVGVMCGKRRGERYALPQANAVRVSVLVLPTASFDRFLPALGAICRCPSRAKGRFRSQNSRNLANVG
jgi:hypothetical protein